MSAFIRSTQPTKRAEVARPARLAHAVHATPPRCSSTAAISSSSARQHVHLDPLRARAPPRACARDARGPPRSPAGTPRRGSARDLPVPHPIPAARGGRSAAVNKHWRPPHRCSRGLRADRAAGRRGRTQEGPRRRASQRTTSPSSKSAPALRGNAGRRAGRADTFEPPGSLVQISVCRLSVRARRRSLTRRSPTVSLTTVRAERRSLLNHVLQGRRRVTRCRRTTTDGLSRRCACAGA